MLIQCRLYGLGFGIERFDFIVVFFLVHRQLGQLDFDDFNRIGSLVRKRVKAVFHFSSVPPTHLIQFRLVVGQLDVQFN